MTGWRTLRVAGPPLLGLGVILLSAFGLHHLTATLHYREIVRALRATPTGPLVWAVAFTALSFLVLALTEMLSLRLAGVRQPGARAAFVSFLSQSIVHTTGFGVVLGASLRYQLYAPYGVRLADVVMSQVFFSSGFGVATLLLLSGAFLLAPTDFLHHLGGSLILWQGMGSVLLLGCVLLLGWSFSRRPLRISGRILTPPPTGPYAPAARSVRYGSAVLHSRPVRAAARDA